MEAQTQKIVDKILRDTRDNAESIIEKAQRSAERMLEQQRELARQKASREVAAILEKTESETEIATVIEASEANKKAKWIILSEKNRLVNNVLDEVKTRLIAFAKSKEYLPFLQRIIVNAGIALEGGKLEILLNEKDSNLLLNLDELTKAVVEKVGTKSQLELSKEKAKASGGAVIRRVDGKILVDNTFEAILKRSEPQLRLKISKILFR